MGYMDIKNHDSTEYSATMGQFVKQRPLHTFNSLNFPSWLLAIQEIMSFKHATLILM